MTAETRYAESTATLFMALELGRTTWKIAFATTRGMRPRVRQIAAGHVPTLWQEIHMAKMRLGRAHGARITRSAAVLAARPGHRIRIRDGTASTPVRTGTSSGT